MVIASFCSDSQQISLYRLFIETSLVAPVAILAASFCILSSSYFSACVQLSHMLSPYSNNGLMNVVYIVSSDFLSSLNLSFLITLILNHALSFI